MGMMRNAMGLAVVGFAASRLLKRPGVRDGARSMVGKLDSLASTIVGQVADGMDSASGSKSLSAVTSAAEPSELNPVIAERLRASARDGAVDHERRVGVPPPSNDDYAGDQADLASVGSFPASDPPSSW